VQDEDDLTRRAQARLGSVLASKYRLDSVLGVGGMASVYAASDRNGRRVAVKLLHTEFSQDREVRQRFARESIAANAVNHPGVLAIIDDDRAEDGSAFLVMELLVGDSVQKLWTEARERMPVRTVLAIARELCDVLVVAHAAGVIHRDIKPENLFVTRNGHLRVLDFGIARVRALAGVKLTGIGSLLGTPEFMAPEQAKGIAGQIDEQTDVWAVGATMFTLLSGRVVHEGRSPLQTAVLAATKPARSLAAVAPELPWELVELVDRALRTEKVERWPSAQALRDAIGRTSFALFGTTSPTIVDEAAIVTTLKAPASEAPLAFRTERLALPQPPAAVPATASPQWVNQTERMVAAPQETPAAPIVVPRPAEEPENTRSRRTWLRALLVVAFASILALAAFVWKRTTPPRRKRR
jgi:serine/threonine-protein kinase